MSRVYPTRTEWNQDDAWDSASDSEDPPPPKTSYLSRPTIPSMSSKSYSNPRPTEPIGRRSFPNAHTNPNTQSSPSLALPSLVKPPPTRTPSSFLSSLGGRSNTSSTSQRLDGEDEREPDGLRLTSKRDDLERQPSEATYEVLVSDPTAEPHTPPSEAKEEDREEYVEPVGGIVRSDVEEIVVGSPLLLLLSSLFSLPAGRWAISLTCFFVCFWLSRPSVLFTESERGLEGYIFEPDRFPSALV